MVSTFGSTIIEFKSVNHKADSGLDLAFQSDDCPIPRPDVPLVRFEQILSDPSLARAMHTPDYFLLVE